MPAVLEPSIAPIDRQLARAAGKIRAADVLVGLLACAVLTLGYAAAMIVLDRTLALPELVRQIGFVAWLAAVAAVAYRKIVRPVTATINPLFVAHRVEAAIPEAKNVVTNYVDLQERDLPDAVRTAITRQAAGEITEADVQKAGESRAFVGLGIAAATLAVLLAVLLLAFSPAQFASLVKRTFRPFVGAEIVSTTRIEVVLPAEPNPTITAGQPFLVQVRLDGRIPKLDGDDRPRLLLRHNPDDPNAEVVPLESGATNREFQLRVPDYLVQNGFWFKVAAGDGETAEFRVTVRPRLLVTGISVAYDYPKYLRMPAETIDRPQIEAYRGTTVTVTATANRAIAGGWLSRDGVAGNQAGLVAADAPEKARFTFTVQESGIYRLGLSTADGETTLDPPAYPITVVVDNAPTVAIDKPAEEVVDLPVNGTLALDAVALDDIGLAKATTVIRKMGDEKPLAAKPYRLALKRESDGSYPTRVELKESVALAEFRELKPGDVLEYFVEVEDNCGVPQPQIGRSPVKRVRLVEAPKEPEKQQQQQQANQQRNDQLQQHDQRQQQQFDQERRDPPKGQGEKNPDSKAETKPNDSGDGGEKGQPQDTKPQPGGEKGQPQDTKPQPGGEKGQPQDTKPQPGGEKGQPQDTKPQPGGEKGQPQDTKPQPGGEKGQPQGGNEGGIDPKQKDKLEQQANAVSKELNKGGDGSKGGQSGEMTPQQKQEMQDAVKDLQSDDPAKRAAAEKKIDSMIGKENREQAQKEAEQIKKDLQSNDPATRDAAQKKVEKAAEQMKQQGGEPKGEMTPEQKQKFEKAAKEMASNDPATKAAGEKAMDEMIGKANREAAQKQAEQIKNDLQSDDPATRQAAKEKLEKMAEQAKKQQGGQAGDKGLSPQEKQDLAKAGDGMKSDDPKQKAEAEKAIDKATGGEQRQADAKAAEQAKNDLKNGDAKAQADAMQTLESMAKKPDGGPPQPGQGMTEKEKQEIADATKNLNSSDPAKRAAAEKTLDDKMGKANREQAQKDAEQLKKDLASNDPATKDAAQKKLEKMANDLKQAGGGGLKPDEAKTAQGGGEQKPKTPEDMKALRDAAKSLNSDNADERKAAQDTLDKELGPDGRQKAEQLSKDLKSDHPGTRKEAEKKFDDLAKGDKGEPGRKPLPEEIKKEQDRLAKAAKDLTSKDDGQRQKAEKELDDAIGQKNREQMQQAMNDLQSGDPAKQEAGKQKLDEMMKQAQANAGKLGQNWKPGGSATGDATSDPLKDNPLDRLKTHELQLKTFKENRTNKELHAKLGYNQQEYDDFVKGFEKLVEAERKQIAVKPKDGAGDQPKVINANRGGEKLGSRGDGTGPTGATAGTAPPGYSDAARKFAEEAAKKGNK